MSARDNWCDPGHWAVLAFATTSFMLGFVNAHLIGGTAVFIVLPVALIFGGLVQLIVALLEVFRGNTFGACVFGTYGPFWIIYALFVKSYAKGVAPATAPTAVALFLAMFAVLTFFFVIASFRTDWVLVAVFILIDVALILLAYGSGKNVLHATEAGGWVTIAFAIIAWYHAAAGLINGTFSKKVLPVGYIGPYTIETVSTRLEGTQAT